MRRDGSDRSGRSAGLERSLFFWNNRSQKSVVLDLRETPAREHLLPAGKRTCCSTQAAVR